MRTIPLALRACASPGVPLALAIVLMISGSALAEHLNRPHRVFPGCRASAPCRHAGCALCGPYQCSTDCDQAPSTTAVQETIFVPETRERDVIIPREVPIIAPVTKVYDENVYYTDVELVHDPVVESYHRVEPQPLTTMVPVSTHRANRGVIQWYPCAVKKLVPVDYGHYEEMECDPDDVCCGEPYYGHPDYDGYATTSSASGGGHVGGCGASGSGSLGTTIISWQDASTVDLDRGLGVCPEFAGPDVKPAVDPCARRMRRVWVPDVRMVEMCVTEMKYHVIERPCETITDVCPVTTFMAVPVTDYVVHHRVRPRVSTHHYPVTHVRTMNELTYKTVPMVERQSYTEMVPKTIEKEVVATCCD